MSQWRHARPCHLCSCCGSGTFGTTGTARALGPDGTSVWTVGAIASPWSHHSVGVQPVKAATARNDRGESQPRVVWGIRAALYQPAFFWCQRSGVAVGTVIALGSGPMFSGLIDLALHRRHPAMKWYTGTAVMLVGVAVLVAGEQTIHPRYRSRSSGCCQQWRRARLRRVCAPPLCPHFARSGVNRGSRFPVCSRRTHTQSVPYRFSVSSSDVGWVWSTVA